MPFWEAVFPGQIDELRAWNIVRTQAEIQASMYTHLTGTEPGLMHYYQMHTEVGENFIFDNAANTSHFLVNMNPATAWDNSPFSFSDPATVTLNILPATTGPDLTIPTLIASPDNVCQGEYFALIFAVANQGDTDAGAHHSLIYDDSDPAGFTHQTFSASIPGILAGQTRYFSLSVNSFFTGTRYLKVFTDGNNVISEASSSMGAPSLPLSPT